jgi:CRP-like cAMP-binding protein
MDDDRFLQDLRGAYPFFSESSLRLMAGQGKIETVRKNQNFFTRGKVDKRIGFVIKGLFKGTIVNRDTEQILWFSNEFDILASYSSILNDEPARLSYTALEDSSIFVISYEQIRRMADAHSELSAGLIAMLEKLLLESFHRLEKFLLYNAEDRYLRILEEKPDILNRIPQKLLASYIGITPVSLSRLRSRLSRR